MSLERGDQGLKEPTYGLGDKFLPFRLPLREWTGYGSPFTMQKALHSSILLQTDEIPNLRFFTVIENEEWWKTDVEWKIWIEADKRQLRRLGMIKQTGRNFAGVTDITDLELLHEFNPEALDKVSSLRVTMWVPEGEYIAAPDPRSLEEGELKFDIFTKIGEPKDPTQWIMRSRLDDKQYLNAIEASITRVN